MISLIAQHLHCGGHPAVSHVHVITREKTKNMEEEVNTSHDRPEKNQDCQRMLEEALLHVCLLHPIALLHLLVNLITLVKLVKVFYGDVVQVFQFELIFDDIEGIQTVDQLWSL